MTLACPPDPCLTDQEQDCHDDAVADECATHDEVSQTLTQVITTTISHGDNPTEQHLYPGDDWECFAYQAMNRDHDFSSP